MVTATTTNGTTTYAWTLSTTASVDFTQQFKVGDYFQMTGWAAPSAGFNNTSYTITELTATTISGTGNIGTSTTVAQSGITLQIVYNWTWGEDNTVAATNFWRKQQLAFRGLQADPSRLLVASNTAVNSTSIAMLSKGASPELFNRNREAASGVLAAAGGAGKAALTALIYMQGGTDAVPTAPALVTPKATYKAALVQLQQDIIADIATTIYGQKSPPLWLNFQVSALNGGVGSDLTIPQAQFELMANPPTPDWYMVGPSYPVTDYGIHFDSNGYRWFGAQIGKVLHRILERGEGWMPVYPTQITMRGVFVLVDFHVPEPPLQLQPVYVAETATTFADAGFRVYDDVGAVSITAVSLVGDTVVQITLARALTTNPYLQYGDIGTHSGSGNLCDSDPTVSDDVYSYTAGNGQVPGANLPALIGKSYPLWNWCCLFQLPIVAS